MELKIVRSKWLHGEGDTHSKLLRTADMKMCCLGFYMKANGATDKDIADETGPDAPTCYDKAPRWLLKFDGSDIDDNDPYSTDCTQLMRINDSTGKRVEIETGRDAREQEIADIFKKHGVDVVFED